MANVSRNERAAESGTVEKPVKEKAVRVPSVEIPRSIGVRQLSELLHVDTILIIKQLMRNGIMANINQVIDYETAAAVATVFGYKTRLQPLKDQQLASAAEESKKLKKSYAMDGASMLWLSYDRDIPYAREPTNIPLIYSEIKNFMDEEQDCIVLISGLEYMIAQSNFIKILKFIQLLNENVAVRDSLLIIPVSPMALDSKEVMMLERELKLIKPEVQGETLKS